MIGARRFALAGACYITAWLLLVATVVALCMVGCDAPRRYEVTSVIITEDWPDPTVYEDKRAVAFVWSTGRVNLNAVMRANCPNTNPRVLGRPVDAGASYRGLTDHMPVVGDTLRGDLILAGPVVDSLNVTRGGFMLACAAPDTMDGYAWAIVPSGPCGPDSIVSVMRLVRAQ